MIQEHVGGEITGLTWDDINWKTGAITINKSTQYIRGIGIREKCTKSVNGDRHLYLSSITLNILKKYQREQEALRFKLGSKWEGSKRIFTTEFGGDMHPDTPSKIFLKIKEKYGLRKIKFHALRHTSISLMIREGVQAQIISKKAGHSRYSSNSFYIL